MTRPQPIRRPRSWRRPVARLARWLTGHPTRTHHQTWRYRP